MHPRLIQGRTSTSVLRYNGLALPGFSVSECQSILGLLPQLLFTRNPLEDDFGPVDVGLAPELGPPVEIV